MTDPYAHLYSVTQLLDYAASRGIINLDSLAEQLTDEMNKKYLEKHKFKVWEDQKQNCWLTWIPDETKRDGRRRIRRKTKKEIDDFLIAHYKAQEKVTTVDDVIRDWIKHKSTTVKNIAPATRLRYEKDHQRYFNGIGTVDIRKITELDLVKHFEYHLRFSFPGTV